MALGTAPLRPRRTSLWIWIIVLGVTAPLVLVLAFGLQRDPRAIPSPLVGQRAPDFRLSLLDGTAFDTTKYRGRVLIINFWASWCFPACYQEAPELQEIWDRYRDRGVVVLGINIQDSEPGAREFIKRFGHTFPNGMDQTGRISIEYGVYGVPETFLIDGQGRLVYKQTGAITAQVIDGKLVPLLRAGRDP